PRRLRILTPIVRLGNQTIDSLGTELDAFKNDTEDPEAAGYTVDAVPMADQIAAASRSSVELLFGAASGLVTIAILNLAMLIAARVRQRRSEFAIRLAVGASRATILGLATMEAGALVFCGAILAVMLSRVVAPMLESRFVAVILNSVVIGGRTLLFAVMVTVVAVLVASIASMAALRAKPSAERWIVSSRLTAGRALVVSQITISVLLVLGSVTLAMSFLNLRQVQPGFRTSGLLTSRIALPGVQYADPSKKARFWRTLLQDLSQTGIEAAITTELPLSGDDNPTTFTTRLSDGVSVGTKLRSLSPNYFDVMHIPLIEGRNLSEKDPAGAAEIAVVVNQKLATV